MPYYICLRHHHRLVSAKRGGIAEDKSNFVALIRDLRAAFDAHGGNFILTAAIGAAAPTIDIAYDIPLMYKYLDFVHIMCYDYHGKWDKRTGHTQGRGHHGKTLNLHGDRTQPQARQHMQELRAV